MPERERIELFPFKEQGKTPLDYDSESSTLLISTINMIQSRYKSLHYIEITLLIDNNFFYSALTLSR